MAPRKTTKAEKTIPTGNELAEEKLKALEHALADLDKEYGKGAVMRLGGDALRRHVLRRDVLDERSSEKDVYELIPAADPEYGEPAPYRARHKRKVEPVPLGVHVARGVGLRVSRRVNILAARHKQKVYARKNLVEPRFVRAMRDQHRNVSGLRKRVKVVCRRDVGRAAAVVTHSHDKRLRVRRQQTRRSREAERHDRADHLSHVDIIP